MLYATKQFMRGEIGLENEAINNLYLLDELLQEIILRLVQYEGKRESRVLLNKNSSVGANL